MMEEAQKLVEEEEITEEQRRRAEANRLAALAKAAKRKSRPPNEDPTLVQGTWKFFKCQKLSSQHHIKPKFSSSVNTSSSVNVGFTPIAEIPSLQPENPTTNPSSSSFVNVGYTPLTEIPPPLTLKFRARLEICSPDSFSVMPERLPGSPFPGEEACFQKLSEWLYDAVPSHYTQIAGGGKGCVYKLDDYEMILKCLKKKGIQCDEIPFGTLNVVRNMSHGYSSGKWFPCITEHLPDEKVDELISNLPKTLLQTLLPFQLEGVRFGVRRGGRCLIADEMGLGKTIQAIAIAGCFMNDGPILIVCPAILRFSWAEELERWFPYCLPSDIHLVFRHQDDPANLATYPKIVVISYTMLYHLRDSMLNREWGTLIIDESHHLRCVNKKAEAKEKEHVLKVAWKAKHLILLSGTPSLSRPFDIFHQIDVVWPGLLGKTKYDFANTYCSVKHIPGAQGKIIQDFSKGVRLVELNVLLQQTVMIRRLKQHVMAQLPPIRRQVIRLALRKSDIASAKAVLEESATSRSISLDREVESSDAEDANGDRKSSKKLGDQVIGLAKVAGLLEWLLLHPSFAELDSDEAAQDGLSSQKMIIFGHHHKVLDRIQEFISKKGIEFMRIDSNVSAKDRKDAVKEFQLSKKVRIALMGIDSGGVGINLTAAQNVVFLELPKDISRLGQAESRAHRFGQTEAVNVYIFCAEDTSDESRWQNLNKSLFRVTTTVDGKYDAKQEIKVDHVSYFQTSGRTDERQNEFVLERESNPEVTAGILGTTCIENSSPDTMNQEPHESVHNSHEMETNAVSSEAQHCQNVTMSGSDFERPSSKARSDFERPSSKATCDEVVISPSRISTGNNRKDKKETVFVQISEEVTSKDSGSFVPDEDAARNFSQLNSLRFEVSLYTGRIHLYSCIPGLHSRPQPLFQSFRMEELESGDSLAEEDNRSQKAVSIEESAKYIDAIKIFTKQWNKLRPIERSKLISKPLQLPLSVELCCLDGNLNHNKGGLLKSGGSTRRSTPIHEISHPLPSDAVWREVRLLSGKKEKVYKQGWSAMDEPLCKLCQTPCTNANAKKPVYFEDLFCKLGCCEEYRMRTNNRSIRQALFEIEHGVCTNCQLDCHKLVEHLRPLSFKMREEYIKKKAPKIATRKKLFDKLVQDPVEGNAWHADHLVPVYLGGGECLLENMRTLCVVCHADVTAAQCADRRISRAKARKRLKAIMNDLKVADKSLENCGNLKEHEQYGTQEYTVDKDFLIEVPGSAYSSTTKSIDLGS